MASITLVVYGLYAYLVVHSVFVCSRATVVVRLFRPGSQVHWTSNRSRVY